MLSALVVFLVFAIFSLLNADPLTVAFVLNVNLIIFLLPPDVFVDGIWVSLAPLPQAISENMRADCNMA
jgi:hypothetical protein